MEVQKENSDEAEPGISSSFQLRNQQPTQQSQFQTTVGALFYKSIKLQSRHYCSNICQIVTPILCLLFTLAVREIVGGITTGAVKSFDYPQPFNMPMGYSLIRSQIGLSCEERYYYEAIRKDEKWIDKIIKLQIKEMCPSLEFSPQFMKIDSVNSGIMDILKLADLQQFQRGDDLKTNIPDGFVKFKQVTSDKLSVTLGINDFRLPEYHKNNGVTKIMLKTSLTTTISTYLRVTEGLMSLLDKLTRPFLQLSFPKQIISGSFMYMPFSGQDKSFVNKMVNVLGSGLYPLGLSLLLPLFLYMVVSQKQQKQLQIMKMNGLDVKYYWANFFIISFILSMITSLNMYIWGIYIIEITFFTTTAGSVIWITFIGWAIAQIAMTSLCQIFINSSKTATIIGYILSIFSTLIGVTLCTAVYPAPMKIPIALLLYPPFSLSRIVFYIGSACADSLQCYRSLSDVDSQVVTCLVILFGWFFVYLLSIWLNEMVQQEFGVAHRPKIIEVIVNRFTKKQKQNQLMEEFEDVSFKNQANQIEMADIQSIDDGIKENRIDESVQQHNFEVSKTSIYGESLIIRELSKKYQMDNGQKQKVALKPLSLKLIKGQIFGFLGPNGAGKTTLISVLTGMYPQSSGNAWISGHQIGFASTNKIIGVCPQFDIIWPDLTVEEHLVFYCKLKQVNPEFINESVKQSLDQVDLYDSRNLAAKQLSGGMQRRLSIAIALVGNPSVVFLDEPSSGLDPFHRRQIWDILMKCKRKTSIFMTSHLMDEVEYLCDRIGIISQGQLRCIGPLSGLKQKYGKGYRLTISYHNNLRDGSVSVRPKIIDQLMQKYKLQIVNELQTRIILKIDKNAILSYAQLLKQDSSLIWSINQPSLYDVFMYFVK